MGGGGAWFASTTRTVVISHHGADEPAGTLGAYRAAYDRGYRWFQADLLAVKDDVLIAHAIFGRRRGFDQLTVAEARAKLGREAPTLSELLGDTAMPDARWNVELKHPSALPHLLDMLDAKAALRSRVLVSAPSTAAAARHRDVRRRRWADDAAASCDITQLFLGGGGWRGARDAHQGRPRRARRPCRRSDRTRRPPCPHPAASRHAQPPERGAASNDRTAPHAGATRRTLRPGHHRLTLASTDRWTPRSSAPSTDRSMPGEGSMRHPGRCRDRSPPGSGTRRGRSSGRWRPGRGSDAVAPIRSAVVAAARA